MFPIVVQTFTNKAKLPVKTVQCMNENSNVNLNNMCVVTKFDCLIMNRIWLVIHDHWFKLFNSCLSWIKFSM